MYNQRRYFLPITNGSRKLRVGVLGQNNLGKAIYNSFNDNVEMFAVDEEFGVNIENLIDWMPDVVYICLDTKLHPGNNRMDASDIEDAFLKLIRRTKSAIALKTLVTPEIMMRMAKSIEDPEDINRFIFSPTISSINSYDKYVDEIRTPSFVVYGGPQVSVNEYINFMQFNTDCMIPAKSHTLNIIEAIYAIYACEVFFGLKNSFFNELRTMLKKEGEGVFFPTNVLKTIASHPKIGIDSLSYKRYDNTFGLEEETEKNIKTFASYTSALSAMEMIVDINNKLKEGQEDVSDGETEEEQSTEGD